MQICDGDEYTTGYGFVGAKTRVALSGAPAIEPQATTTASAPSTNEYTPEQQQQITALQAQIVELTKVLADLIAQRGS